MQMQQAWLGTGRGRTWPSSPSTEQVPDSTMQKVSPGSPRFTMVVPAGTWICFMAGHSCDRWAVVRGASKGTCIQDGSHKHSHGWGTHQADYRAHEAPPKSIGSSSGAMRFAWLELVKGRKRQAKIFREDAF